MVMELVGLLLVCSAVTLSVRALLTLAADYLRKVKASEGSNDADAVGRQLGRAAARPGRLDTLLPGIRRNLGRAGRASESPESELGRTLLWGLGAGGAVGVVAGALGSTSGLSAGAISAFLLGTMAGLVTFSVKLHELRTTADRRISRIVRQLPYSLDLSVLTMEAGSSLDETIELLCRDQPDEPLHEELGQVLREQRLGQSRRESFRAMGDRLQSDDISSLVLGIEMGEELGTPLADTLRRQSEGARHSRFLRAERVAREASAKMTLPNTLILVANVLLILTPFIPRLVSGGGIF